MRNVSTVFVYGTLKRGQSREKCWPRKPTSIQAATVRGTLYDLGPYPGLIAGDDLVAGEIWHFAAKDMAATLAALDEIEGYHGQNYHGQDDDEYRRVIVECAIGEKHVAAWAYQYARPAVLASAQRITPNGQGVCQWRAVFS
jgi:gamma-glutamylcyclotransferase (GGCT)/AIG2-like uncharacterized protein YtfP